MVSAKDRTIIKVSIKAKNFFIILNTSFRRKIHLICPFTDDPNIVKILYLYFVSVNKKYQDKT